MDDRHLDLHLGERLDQLILGEQGAHLSSRPEQLRFGAGPCCGPQPAEDKSWRPHGLWN